MNKRIGSTRLTAGITLITFVLIGSAGPIAHAHAGDRNRDTDEVRIRRGFEIAPVPLYLDHKDLALVGLGSYLVNAMGGCNDCHTASVTSEYASGGDPYFKGNPPKVINQAAYLSGGRNFGALIPGTPEIVSRNLTPDKTGRPVGGRTFYEFREIMRTGVDLDHLHPNCSATVTSNCFPAEQPFNGDLLQIMPWSSYQNLTEHDLRAIYEYLSAIPCLEGTASGKKNECT
jgi:hypothetical protein